MASPVDTLHIPSGVRFSCSSCGDCCFSWPVPATREDFKRIKAHASEFGSSESDLFRVLQSSDAKLQVFTHSLEKRADGKCVFLTEQSRCALHERFGEQEKPAMCRMFPYTFTATPSGIYASVSFASTAVILNQGEDLDNQEEHLRSRLDLFRSLFPGLELDWSGIQVIDGVDISWSDYIEKEAPLLALLASGDRAITGARIERSFNEACRGFRDMIPGTVNLNDMAGFDAPAKLIDQHLIEYLLRFYFPDDIFNCTTGDMDARDLLSRVLSGQTRVAIADSGRQASIASLVANNLGRLPDSLDDILRRFLYLRVFSKLYFGPGFNFLSIVSGLHHLTILACLLRLRLKLDLISGQLERADLDSPRGVARLTEHVRLLERRLTICNFSQESVAMLEVFCASPDRVERVVTLSS
ncbi:MAG: YkgJ family cysteine cluster protein [Candidatus Obscuribacterales bacterium]